MKSILLDILNEEDLKLINKATLIDSSNHVCKTLKEKGFQIGIFTRNYSKLVYRLLKNSPPLNLILFWEGMKGENKQEQLIYILHCLNFVPHQVIVVGDHVSDISAAKGVGCYALG